MTKNNNLDLPNTSESIKETSINMPPNKDNKDNKDKKNKYDLDNSNTKPKNNTANKSKHHNNSKSKDTDNSSISSRAKDKNKTSKIESEPETIVNLDESIEFKISATVNKFIINEAKKSKIESQNESQKETQEDSQNELLKDSKLNLPNHMNKPSKVDTPIKSNNIDAIGPVPKQDEKYNSIFNRIGLIKKSFRINYIFYIVFIGAILYLSIKYGSETLRNDRIKAGLLTSVIALLAGWYVHIIAHYCDFEKHYLMFKNSKGIIAKIYNFLPKFIHKIIEGLVYFCDFHVKIHHDSTINKKWYNVILEFTQNMIMEGIWLVILSRWLQFGIKFGKKIFKLNHTILLLWALLYSSVHCINYNYYVKNLCHIDHHKYVHCNYGIDTLDVMFNSKSDITMIENFNHGAINVIVIVVLFTLIKDCKSENSIVKFLQYCLK